MLYGNFLLRQSLKSLKDFRKSQLVRERQFQAVVGDVMREYLARKRQQALRCNVLEAFDKSLKERDELYRSLAK